MVSRALVTGAGAGLGAAIARELHAVGVDVVKFDRKFGNDVRDPQATFGDAPKIDLLVNCAGINRTAWFEDLTEELWDEVLDINAKGIYRMAQWALPRLVESKGTILNIVSNAAHMPMTTSLAYNCSKAAALMATKQLARELTKKHGITVFSISPNKLRGTEMSKDIEDQVVALRGWTPEYAQQYQLNALLAGEETDPQELARFVAYLLKEKARHKVFTGCDIPYGL